MPLTQYTRRTESWPVCLGGLTVYVSRDDLKGDLRSITNIFARRIYDTDYQSATVLDIGAHKGYFGAYALFQGARRVISYEPEEGNYTLLSRATSQGDWKAYKVAVGAKLGTITLYVSHRSRSHSTVERRGDAIGAVEVPMVALADILSGLDGRVLVKINAEGAECNIVLNTPHEAWAGVSELFISTHRFASCSREQLVAAAQRAGLKVAHQRKVLHFVR